MLARINDSIPPSIWLFAAWAALLLFALLLSGCIPDSGRTDPSRAQVDVEPASGGGGDIAPAKIPVQVEVSVGETRTTCTECGCKLWGSSKQSTSDRRQTSPPSPPVGYAVTVDSAGH